MKLVHLICPGCGAVLDINAHELSARCPYCDKTFPVDDEVMRLKIEDMEQAGYEFERGRQRAKAEFGREQMAQDDNVQQAAVGKTEVQKKPRPRRLWLWALGWLCVFPVPLMVLVSRNNRIDDRFRIVIIVVAWVVYIVMVIWSNVRNG